MSDHDNVIELPPTPAQLAYEDNMRRIRELTAKGAAVADNVIDHFRLEALIEYLFSPGIDMAEERNLYELLFNEKLAGWLTDCESQLNRLLLMQK